VGGSGSGWFQHPKTSLFLYFNNIDRRDNVCLNGESFPIFVNSEGFPVLPRKKSCFNFKNICESFFPGV
jgi:hypothetical protein